MEISCKVVTAKLLEGEEENATRQDDLASWRSFANVCSRLIQSPLEASKSPAGHSCRGIKVKVGITDCGSSLSYDYV